MKIMNEKERLKNESIFMKMCSIIDGIVKKLIRIQLLE
jgi:hypothetical protein